MAAYMIPQGMKTVSTGVPLPRTCTMSQEHGLRGGGQEVMHQKNKLVRSVMIIVLWLARDV
jgi:hypothetical protein